MYNKKDIPELEAKIAAKIAKEGTDESSIVERFIEEIADPSTGLIYKPGENGAPGHLVIAEGWIFNDAGNIVKLEDAVSPSTGKIYKDGKLVDAQ